MKFSFPRHKLSTLGEDDKFKQFYKRFQRAKKPVFLLFRISAVMEKYFLYTETKIYHITNAMAFMAMIMRWSRG